MRDVPFITAILLNIVDEGEKEKMDKTVQCYENRQWNDYNWPQRKSIHRCDICNVYATSKISLNYHLRGSKHSRMLLRNEYKSHCADCECVRCERTPPKLSQNVTSPVARLPTEDDKSNAGQLVPMEQLPDGQNCTPTPQNTENIRRPDDSHEPHGRKRKTGCAGVTGPQHGKRKLSSQSMQKAQQTQAVRVQMQVTGLNLKQDSGPHMKAPNVRENENKIEDLKSLKAENEKLREMQICKICMEQDVNTTLLPCGHLVSCNNCASPLQLCPICRKRIEGSVRTFMA